MVFGSLSPSNVVRLFIVGGIIMRVNVVIQRKTTAKGYCAVARYRVRTLRHTFRVEGLTLAQLNQEVLRQINACAKTIPKKVTIVRVPKDSGLGRFILNVIPATERLRG